MPFVPSPAPTEPFIPQPSKQEPTQNPCLPGKRPRCPLADVVHIMWKSEGQPDNSFYCFVRLSVPSPGEECPITQEPIASPLSDLEFLPGVAFRDMDPTYRRAQLDCNHTFCAMQLVYHFFRNGMHCPLCRAGSNRTLASVCIPSHFRHSMGEHLVVQWAKDREELYREDLATASQIDVGTRASLIITIGTIVNGLNLTPREQNGLFSRISMLNARLVGNRVSAAVDYMPDIHVLRAEL
jgi:hypothetical protein